MTEKLRVMIHGAGKMGTAAAEAISAQDDMGITYVVDTNVERSRLVAKRFGDKIKGAYAWEKSPSEQIKDIDVIVDFTSQEGCRKLFETLATIYYMADYKGLHDNLPSIVTGTTPLSQKTEEYMNELTKKRDVVVIKAPNFSVNVNKFLHDMENMAPPSLDDYISIDEVHRQEKASVSGTAKEIAKGLCKRFGMKGYATLFPPLQAFDSEGSEIKSDNLPMTRLSEYLSDPKWIKVSAARFADEPGTHVVRIGNQDSYREYRVRATREDYAEGVVISIRALPGLAEKGPGIYDFKSDILKL